MHCNQIPISHPRFFVCGNMHEKQYKIEEGGEGKKRKREETARCKIPDSKDAMLAEYPVRPK